MPSKNYFLAVLVLTFSCTILGSCTSRSESQLRALLQKGIEHGFPGIAILVQEGNGKIHSAAVGYADLEHHTPIRVDHAFHMASINKTFTAVAVLRLVDEGKLILNDTLQNRLGDAASRIPYADRVLSDKSASELHGYILGRHKEQPNSANQPCKRRGRYSYIK